MSSGHALLGRIARREAYRRTLALVLPAVAAGLALGLWARHWPEARLAFEVGGALLLLGTLAGLYWLHRQQLPALTRRLNRLYPGLEDSAGLLLADEATLNLLESLQVQRVHARLTALHAQQPWLLPFSWWPAAAGTVGLALLAAGATQYQRPVAAAKPALAVRFSEPGAPAQPGRPAPPQLLDARVRVVPPAYTRRAAFAPATLSFSCPAGSVVRWTVRVSRATTAAPVLAVGARRIPFRQLAGRPDEFTVEVQATGSGLYHFRFAGKTSDDYALDVVPDQPPTVHVRTPKPYTLIEFGQRPQVAVQVLLRDDYGLTEAQLVATVAQGQGEAVKFREVVTPLRGNLRAQPRQATATASLQLPALGLTYGDEVYFHVRVRDNARHLSRSDTYLVQWEDTTVQDGLTDLALGVNVVPAYFRSQRQIIIDTEKLLADRATLPAPTFADRANSLAHDQKVLRLRYGKFLGEEFEGGIGESAPRPPAAEDDDHAKSADKHADEHAAETPEEHAGHAHEGHDHSPAGQAAAAGGSADLMEAYVHRHDDAETADFLEPAVKAKLRGVLNQMWEAELRLRLAQPAQARPFEYRALRLLKQVQQQTRAYVRKSGFEPPVLPEATARLSGDLTGAAAPRRTHTAPPPATQPELRAAVRLLATLRAGQALQPADAPALERAGHAVAQAALQQPGAYLAAVRALRQLSADARGRRTACFSCLAPAERALTSLLPPPPTAPARFTRPNRLGQRYFQELTSARNSATAARNGSFSP